jgi:hypothetical protein
MRSQSRWIVVLLVVTIALGVVTGLALAATTTYKNSQAYSGLLYTSDIDDIWGGSAYSSDVDCSVLCEAHIRTTLSWYPYYIEAQATGGGGYVYMSHSTLEDDRSRCKLTWPGGEGTMHLRCRYYH